MLSKTQKNTKKILNLFKLRSLQVFMMVLFIVFQTTAQHLPFTNLSIPDGLDDTLLYDLEQDDQGFLWIATRTGINRFDGDQFWTYGENEGLPHPLVRDLYKTKNGTIWAASEGGVAWFDGSKFQSLKDWPKNISAIEITQATDGTLWVASYGAGILQIKTGAQPEIINQYNLESGLPSESIRTILLDDKDNIWFGVSNKLFLIADGQINEIPWKTKATQIKEIYQHSDGTIWLGTMNGVAYFNGKSIDTLDLGGDLKQQIINTISRDNSGEVWLGTRGNGSYKIHSDGGYTYLDTSDGLPDENINRIFHDNKDNLWFATYGGGLARLSVSKVMNWKTQMGMPNPNVSAISEDKNGCYWFGTSGNGVSKLCDGQFTQITTEDGLPHNKVLSILFDNNQEPWIGTQNGLSHYTNDKFINYGSHSGLTGSLIYQVFQAKNKSLWIATANGLNQLIGDEFIQFTVEDGLSDNRINKIIDSKNGGLWMATGNGLSRYKDNKFSSWTLADGLPSNYINDIYEDDLGGLWIAGSRGLAYFKDGIFENWTTKDGLPHNNCTVILPAENGDIWIGTTRGIGIFNGNSFTVITSREGLVFDSINRGAGYRATNGSLWFGTSKGVSQFAKDYHLAASDPPPVHLMSVSNNDISLPMDTDPELKQENSSLLFNFSAISFQRAPDVSYHYRLLKNGTGQWRETRLRQIQIDSLAAGKYAFEVTARIGKGQWNSNIAAFEFTVIPPFWQTWWFILVVVSAVLGVFIYKNLVNKRHAAHLEKMVSERTKQLEELNHGLTWHANHDNLTQLANRNYVNENLSQISPNDPSQRLGMIMIDLDCFKNFNDKYGHIVGDQVLKKFAKLLTQLVRNNQIAARWGGEEFLIVCPQITKNRLQSLAQQILNGCRNLNIQVNAETKIQISCSLGLALIQQSKQQIFWEKTIQLADLALYDAKHNGRDCAIAYVWQKEPDNINDMNKVLANHLNALEQGILTRLEIT